MLKSHWLNRIDQKERFLMDGQMEIDGIKE